MDDSLPNPPPDPSPQATDAAEAFDQLRGEIGLMRRAVEQLISEQRAAPEYTERFDQLDGNLRAVMRWCRAISERPGMTLTPERYAADVIEAGQQVRAQDQATIADATSRLERLVVGMDGKAEQSRRQRLVGGGAFLAGLILAAGLFTASG